MRRLPRSVLAALLAVRFLDESSQFVLPGTAELLRGDLRLDYTQVGSAFVLLAVGALAGAPATVAADRHDRRWLCVGGTSIGAVALTLMAVATAFPVFAAGCFLAGVASTVMVDTAEIALADTAAGDLERHLTTQNVLGAVGDLAGPAIVVGVLAVGGSWRWCFVVAAVLCAAYAVWLSTLTFPQPGSRSGDHDGEATRAGSVLSDPAVWLLAVCAALLNPLDEPLLSLLVPHLVSTLGVDHTLATVVASMSVPGAFAGYASLRRWPASIPVDAAAMGLAATTCVVAPDLVTTSAASAGVGLFLVRVWVDVQRRVLTVRPGRAGAVKAVVTVAEAAALALPVGAGALADRAGIAAGVATFAVVAWVVAGVAIVIQRRSPRR